MTVTSRLRATVLQGVPWSSKMNWPSVARTDLTVVTNRFGPFGPSRVNFGKLCCPFGHVSTTIVQPVIRTDSNSTSRWISAESGSEIVDPLRREERPVAGVQPADRAGRRR